MSFYPPDYVISSSCQEQAAVQVCAINRAMGHYPRLQVTYKGHLMKEHWGQLSVYIRINGRDHVFPLKNQDYRETVTVGGPAAVRICKAGIKLTPEDELPPYSRTCEHTTEPAGSIVWEADPIPADEAALFFYAYNGFQANAWDVAVAFVSDDGQWDSIDGKNYLFRFDY